MTPTAFLDLHGVERDTLEVEYPLTIALIEEIDLGNVVSFVWPRLGYDSGRYMMVIGVRLQFAQGRCVLVLWG
jgi:hypothetical protein